MYNRMAYLRLYFASVVILSAVAFSQDLSRVKGFWLGRLTEDGKSRRVQVSLTSDTSGKTVCTYDSLDQHAMGMPCKNITLAGDKFTLTVPMLSGTFIGSLSANNNTITGGWKQETQESLTLEWGSAAAPVRFFIGHITPHSRGLSR